MKPKEVDQISKHAWDLIELSTMSTMQNVTKAVANGALKIERSQLTKLIQLIKGSISQGYDQGIREFETQVTKTLASDASKKK